MAFNKLTPPNNGISFLVFNILFHLNFAKTLVWSKQENEDTKRTSYFMAITLVERDYPEGIVRALNVILGPFKITIGIGA